MDFGFRLFCLVIVSLGHEGVAFETLVDSRMSLPILKRAGLDCNDAGEANVMFTGNNPLVGNKQMNGQLFRISKKKEQDTIIPDIERKFHWFLLR